jgi:hypothetical protein
MSGSPANSLAGCNHLGLARLDPVEGEVRREEERFILGRPDLCVHLDEPAATPRELVLRLVELRHLGVRAAVPQHVELVVAEREPLPDEAHLVGVDDRAVGCPDLDPADVADEQAVGHHPIEAVRGAGASRRQAGWDLGLGHRSREQLRSGSGMDAVCPVISTTRSRRTRRRSAWHGSGTCRRPRRPRSCARPRTSRCARWCGRRRARRHCRCA